MRQVIDTNYFGAPELRDYLLASRKNRAVISPYAELEIANADRVEDFLKSTEIVAQFSKQVILSKKIEDAGILRGKKKGLKKRLTDGRRTRTFRKWCVKRGKLARGDKDLEAQRVRARDGARSQLKDISEGGKNIKDDLIDHADGRFTREELAIIRAGAAFTPDLIAKIKTGVSHFAQKLFEASPHLDKVPPIEEWPFSFIYRYAVCAYMHSLHWIAAGGAKDRKPDNFRNDFVDVAIIAYATCFDGLLSKDKVAIAIYNGAIKFLKAE